MLEFIVPFIVYLLAFVVGSLLALLVVKQLYPASSEHEALADLTRKGVN